MAATSTASSSVPRLEITLGLHGAATEENIQKAVNFMRNLGFPVKKCRSSVDSDVIFTPIEGFPNNKEPLIEAIRRQYYDPMPLIRTYAIVGPETVQQLIDETVSKRDQVSLTL